MNLLLVPFEEITEDHLDRLVQAAARESYCLEYKMALPPEDGAEFEFSKDISAMSNWVGGDIVYGMSEMDQGAASKIFSLGDVVNAQRVLDKWQAIADARIAPRIPGLRFRSVALNSGGFAMVVRVPKSYLAPHAVRINREKGQLAYWIRTDSHVRPMPEDEVRRRYVAGPDLIQTVNRIRYSNVLSKEMTIDGPYWPNSIMIHCMFVPVEGLMHDVNHAYATLKKAAGNLTIDGKVSPQPMPCLEGAFLHGGANGGIEHSWAVHRNGTIVWTDAGTCRVDCSLGELNKVKQMNLRYQKNLTDRLSEVRAVLSELGVLGQVAVGLSLTRTKGAVVPPDMNSRKGGKACPHEEIHAPVFIVDSPTQITPDEFSDSFEVVLNTFGLSESK